VGWGGGEWCRRLDRQNPRGGKGQQNEYLKLEKNYFLCPTSFELFVQITGNTINNCDFFKVRIFSFGVAIVITRPRTVIKPSYATAVN
jgi:hypothetical protein